MMTGYCIHCGRDFIDGDAVFDRSDGSMHRECQQNEEAMEATWQDTMGAIE